jgi:hypothetical protein
LIEYEPTQAEAMVTGLVTEFSAYRFLTRCFDADTDGVLSPLPASRGEGTSGDRASAACKAA